MNKNESGAYHGAEFVVQEQFKTVLILRDLCGNAELDGLQKAWIVWEVEKVLIQMFRLKTVGKESDLLR